MTKEEVLRVFEQYKGEIVSGNELAEKLGITRAAIWKTINSLREEGYDIEAIKKKGYRLNVNSDILSHIKIEERLKEDVYDIRLYKTIDSTNKAAKIAAITEDKEWIVVASEMQELGKGHMQSKFASPQGKGVYMSIVIKPSVSTEDYPRLLRCIGESVAEGIEKVAGIKPEVTEDNQVICKGKKIGGILSEGIVELESQLLEVVVIGIGIYIYDDKSYENEIERSVGCLGELTGNYTNRSELIAEVLNVFYEKYSIYSEEMC